MTVFLVLILILLVLIAIVVAAATGNRQANYQMNQMYVEPQPVVIVDDTPLIAGMVAADIAADIAFSGGGQMGMDQGQYYDNQDQGFGGGGFDNGGGSFDGGGFDSGSSGFDIGGGGDF